MSLCLCDSIHVMTALCHVPQLSAELGVACLTTQIISTLSASLTRRSSILKPDIYHLEQKSEI